MLAVVVAAVLFFETAPREAGTPRVLRVGVLPDENPAVLQRRYSSLIEHLAAKTGIETRLVVPASYDDAVRLFADGEVDLAYFGGFTFVRAHSRHQAQALVMREVDTQFVSWFLTRSENSNRPLGEFRGQKLGFGSQLSTSGHLMPRHFLHQRWQIDPDKHFSDVSYSGAHDKTVEKVLNGEVDIGAVNSVIVKKMIASGRVESGALHVVWETPPYPDYVWATQAFIGEDLENRLRDAFLELDWGNPRHDRILRDVSARSFLPADYQDFELLEEVASDLGLMRDES